MYASRSVFEPTHIETGVRIGHVGRRPAGSVDTHLLRQVQLSGGSGKLGPFISRHDRRPLPRPVLLAIVGVVLFGGVFMFTRRRSDTAEHPGALRAAQPAPAATTPAQPGTATTPGQTAGTGAVGQGRQLRRRPGPARAGAEGARRARRSSWSCSGTRKAVDDRSVKSSVDRPLAPRRQGRGRSPTGVKNLSRYTRITAAASVTQTPSLVIVNREGQAEVLTGYHDYQTIGQYVAERAAR